MPGTTTPDYILLFVLGGRFGCLDEPALALVVGDEEGALGAHGREGRADEVHGRAQHLHVPQARLEVAGGDEEAGVVDRERQLPIAYRNTVANMMAEAEAQNGIFAPDETTFDWFRAKGMDDLLDELAKDRVGLTRIGTRGSRLALWQAEWVQRRAAAMPPED